MKECGKERKRRRGRRKEFEGKAEKERIMETCGE